MGTHGREFGGVDYANFHWATGPARPSRAKSADAPSTQAADRPRMRQVPSRARHGGPAEDVQPVCRMAFYCDANSQAVAWKWDHKTSFQLQSATEHLFPPPCAMHVPVGPAAAFLLQSETKHLFTPPWAQQHERPTTAPSAPPACISACVSVPAAPAGPSAPCEPSSGTWPIFVLVELARDNASKHTGGSNHGTQGLRWRLTSRRRGMRLAKPLS